MLAVDGLSFEYRRGAEELFDGLSYEFRTGAMTAVTGPSGRGKSTLLYVLGLMLTPTRGRVLLDGEPVSQRSDRRRSRVRAEQIGFVFQDAALDASRKVLDSVIEPALYGGSGVAQAKRRARVLMERMGVGTRADHRPGEVSGGQAQRLAVCRALVTDPAVVLADEPTGNLDRANAAEVLNALSAATSGSRTVVIATHDPFVLEHADEVLAL
ncbi:MAG: ATP-binding cassette domain-containing protein [Propionibacteriaceae bacterium]|nr:ATP-binding cassette domain-containing protein [Propionibacteriaceae bacterium]